MGDFLIKLVRPDLAFSSLRDFIELGGDVPVSYTHLTLPTIYSV